LKREDTDGEGIGSNRREFRIRGAKVEPAGAGGLLGAVVRAVQNDRARGRRTGRGIRRQAESRQAQRRRESHDPVALRRARHSQPAHSKRRGWFRRSATSCLSSSGGLKRRGAFQTRPYIFQNVNRRILTLSKNPTATIIVTIEEPP